MQRGPLSQLSADCMLCGSTACETGDNVSRCHGSQRGRSWLEPRTDGQPLGSTRPEATRSTAARSAVGDGLKKAASSRSGRGLRAVDLP